MTSLRYFISSIKFLIAPEEGIRVDRIRKEFLMYEQVFFMEGNALTGWVRPVVEINFHTLQQTLHEPSPFTLLVWVETVTDITQASRALATLYRYKYLIQHRKLNRPDLVVANDQRSKSRSISYSFPHVLVFAHTFAENKRG